MTSHEIDRMAMKLDHDANHLLRTFPEELWLLIMDQMGNQDVENFCNSSPYFRQIYRSKRVHFLFPKVWGILEAEGYLLSKKGTPVPASGEPVQQAPQEPVVEENNGTVPANDSAGVLLDRGPRKILKLRLVCKSWKDAVDCFLQERLLHTNPRDVRYGKYFVQKFLPYTTNRTYNPHMAIPAFLLFFEGSHGNPVVPKCAHNPFFSRVCSFSFLDTYEDLREDIDFILLLLSAYGHHLHKCSFHLDHTVHSDYTKLRGWFRSLPNLKVLEISEWEIDGNRTERVRIAEDMEANPLPKMKDLERLTLWDVEPLLVSSLLQANSHVTHLELIRCQNNGKFNIFLHQLPHLTRLKIDIFSNLQFDRLNAAQFSPAFHTLDVEFYFIEIFPEKIFTLLGNKWGKTLTSVSLYMRMESSPRPEEEAKRHLLSEFTRLQKMWLPDVSRVELDAEFAATFDEAEYFNLL